MMVVTIYDESNAVSENVHLTNKVDTINVEFVGLSLPTGVLRLEYNNHCTHFVITLNGKQWCLAVNEIQNLGNGLFDFFYEVDYLKDYWMNHSSDSLRATIYRSSNASYWNKYMPDELFTITNNPTATNTVGTSYTWWRPVTGGGVSFVVSMNTTTYTTPTLFVVDGNGANSIIGACAVSEKVQNIINIMYAIPSPAIANVPKTVKNFSDVKIRNANWLGNLTETPLTQVLGGSWDVPGDKVTPPSNYTITELDISPQSLYDNIPSFNYNLGLTIPHSDWRDFTLKKYYAQIPLIGSVEIDASKIYGELSVQYYINYYDGTVKATINNNVNTMTQGSALPQVPIGSGNASISAQKATTSALASIASVAASAFTKTNPATSVPSWIATGVTAMNAVSDFSLISKQPIVYSQSNGTESITMPRCFMTTLEYEGKKSMSEHALTNGYISGSYVYNLTSLLPGWHQLTDVDGVIGPPWYAEQVKKRLSERIYV